MEMTEMLKLSLNPLFIYKKNKTMENVLLLYHHLL